MSGAFERRLATGQDIPLRRGDPRYETFLELFDVKPMDQFVADQRRWIPTTGQLDLGVIFDLPTRWHPIARARKRRLARQFLKGPPATLS